jgi:hypothetical protein
MSTPVQKIRTRMFARVLGPVLHDRAYHGRGARGLHADTVH